ncbi:MAG: BrnA antitoxin family protein [Vampirovibrionales bacterium]|nr:BrnA antitoxin family protein [Vampirovibrionales bacterium]
MAQKRKIGTDWDYLRNLTEAEIEANALADPDAQPLPDEFWQNATLVIPDGAAKNTITIRLSPRVLAFFKQQGKGYQSRINAVLEAYVAAQQKNA